MKGRVAMKIEVFSDFTCPFCYIGKKQLEQAIEEAGYAGQVEIEYKMYQLAPDASTEHAQPFYEAMVEKQHQSLKKVKEMTAEIAERAKEFGLIYNFDKIRMANTKKAHRLAKWVRQFGKEEAYTELLMAGYFTHGANLNNEETLLSFISQLDLDKEEAKAVLRSDAFTEVLEIDQYHAQQIGVQSVPFFVFENKYGIIGAEPNEVFIKTLHQAAAIAGIQPVLKIVSESNNSCSDESCKI